MSGPITITVRHRPNTAKSPKIYLLELTRDQVSWQVLKRYKQFRDLHVSFKKLKREGYQYCFHQFPKRHLSNSYRPETVAELVTLLQEYCEYLVHNSYLTNHSLFLDFIHSDIYLDSYQTLKEAEALQKDIEKTKELSTRLQQLQEDITSGQQEHESVSDKYQILLKNTTELSQQTQDVYHRLSTGNNRNRQSYTIKKQLHEEICSINDQYTTLRCHLSLTGTKQTQTKNKLETIKQTLLELTDMVRDTTQRIQALEDACLLHSWNHEEYQRIHHQISDNISSKLSVLTQDTVF